MKMSQRQIWMEAMRPKTLPAAVTPVLLGTGMAYADGGFHWGAATICLLFALLIQIGTNFANDYLDGVKGTDTEKRIGPVRAVANGLVTPECMKRVTLVTLGIAFCIGLGLIPFGGWWLLGVGIASVLCSWLYTGGPYPLAYNGLGDLFVVLFFGLIAVGCTYYVQTGTLSLPVVLLGFGSGLLVNNLLIVNNYRDLEEDLVANKRTSVVLLGRQWAQGQYLASALIAGGVITYLSLHGYGFWLLLGWLPLCVSIRQGVQLSQRQGAVDFLLALKLSGIVVAAFGFLVTLGLVLGG